MSNSQQQSNSASASQNVPSNSASNSASGNTGISIPPTAAAGGLTITQPPQASTSYFKIASGQPITFGWNLTSLYVTPEHLTISAYCPENNNQYPVTVVPGTVTEITWDVWSYNQANQATPLPPQTYQLEIWDDRGPGVGPLGGRFSPNSALKFALYSPQPYTPLASGWQCLGCKSGALERVTAHPAFTALITTLVICLLSGYGLLRRHH